uniref:Gonadotropin-releasing hormone receptor n=1 Tax=Erpetoichthys calabaricus TaxID=27687 RepID=A0A8C4RX63_ERPCA
SDSLEFQLIMISASFCYRNHLQLNGRYNISSREEMFIMPTFSTAAKIRVVITFFIFLSSTCFNIAVLWTISQKYQRKSHIKVLMMNLAAADLLVTFIVMPLDAIWNITVQWYGGDLACRLLMFLKLVAMYSSAFVTVVISVDRQAAILNPLGIGEAKKKNKMMLSIAWTLSVILAVPQLFVFHTVSRATPVQFVQCATLGSFQEHWEETLYNMFTFTCLFLLPLTIMVLCYSRILFEISRKMKKACVSSKEIQLRRSSNNIPKARLRTLKMSIVIVLTFVICWTPYYLLGLWYWFSPEMLTQEQVPPSLSHILFLFGLFNACLDPIIYGLFTIHFRREIQRACRCTGLHRDSDAVSLGTGSFHCSSSVNTHSSGHLKRAGTLSRDRSSSRNEKYSATCNLCRGSVTESMM